ncbi:MAG: DUF711 family protein [Anaerolineales bacterium]|nr:DUF711 family protein [Anaerolineales bacterium]
MENPEPGNLVKSLKEKTMKIRSITYFCNPGWPLDIKMLQAAGAFLAEARAAFEAADYEVQTTRLATAPFPRMLGEKKISETPKLAAQMAEAVQTMGVAYAALGPALPEMPESYTVIPAAAWRYPHGDGRVFHSPASRHSAHPAREP